MATEPPVYDLVLLLDTQADDERRSQLLDNVQAAIEKGGEVVGRHDWGVRPTVYEVQKRPDADYHLFQFHGDNALLEQLGHTLKITDGVLRFRIIKLRAGPLLPAGTFPPAPAKGITASLGSRGGPPSSRGHATASASTPTTAAARPTLPQRTRIPRGRPCPAAARPRVASL